MAWKVTIAFAYLGDKKCAAVVASCGNCATNCFANSIILGSSGNGVGAVSKRHAMCAKTWPVSGRMVSVQTV